MCVEARCPNIGECYDRKTATFIIMGPQCTRHCRFCAVNHGKPGPLSADEPDRVAEAAARLGLRHVVVTSVTRDDLPDGGAAHFAATVRSIRRRLPNSSVEVLTPDFGGNLTAVRVVMGAGPQVYGHNVETVPRLYPLVRPGAHYETTLSVLREAKAYSAIAAEHAAHVKTSIMVGLGETEAEVLAVMKDLLNAGCTVLTVGQYLRPSPSHVEVQEFVTPTQFERYEEAARAMGFSHVLSGSFVRSSYRASEVFSGGFSNERP